MTVISTRRALLEDARAAVGVVRDSISQLCLADHQNDPLTLELWLRNKTNDDFARWLENADNHIIVAELDSTIRGVGALHRSGEIRLCYVSPACKGVGIGRALLTALEAQATAWGIPKLLLKSTIGARAFYEHNGYTVAGGPACGIGGAPCFPYEKLLASQERT